MGCDSQGGELKWQPSLSLKGLPLAGKGVLAQLVERFNGIEEVSGSTPLHSTFLILQPPVPEIPIYTEL